MDTLPCFNVHIPLGIGLFHPTRIDTHWWLPLQFLYTTPEDGHEPCPKHVVIINQVKQKLHLVGYLLTRYFKDARYHERNKYS